MWRIQSSLNFGGDIWEQRPLEVGKAILKCLRHLRDHRLACFCAHLPLSPMELSVLDWMSKSFFLSQVSTAKLRSDAIRSLHITKRLRWKSVSNALPDSVPVRTGSDMREWMYHRAMPWTLECKHKYTCASFKILVQQMCGYETQAFRMTRYILFLEKKTFLYAWIYKIFWNVKYNHSAFHNAKHPTCISSMTTEAKTNK